MKPAKKKKSTGRENRKGMAQAEQPKENTIQFTAKSGKGNRDGVISELATFYEVKPGHEEELRAACERLANTLKNAPVQLNIETGLRDERNVIFDGGAISPRRFFARNSSRSAFASVRVRARSVFIRQTLFASAYPIS